jgi:flagella basal body P-ring formation protein FlgA
VLLVVMSLATACGSGGSVRTGSTSPTVPPTSVSGAQPLATVFVAGQDIAKGTTGEAAAIEIHVARIEQQFKPSTALSSTTQLDGRVALFNIPKNSVIVTDMFANATPSTSP